MKLILFFQIGLFSLLSLHSDAQEIDSISKPINIFTPNQKSVNFIYNKLIDYLVDNSLFADKRKRPLFKPTRDSVFIDPNLVKYKPFSWSKLRRDTMASIEDQNLFEKLSFSDNYFKNKKAFPIENKRYNRNIWMKLSSIRQFEDKLLISVDLNYYSFGSSPEIPKQTNAIIEFIICEENYYILKMGIIGVFGDNLSDEAEAEIAKISKEMKCRYVAGESNEMSYKMIGTPENCYGN